MPRKTKEIQEEKIVKKTTKKTTTTKAKKTGKVEPKKTAKKSTAEKASKTTTKKVTPKVEYYDLPYSYNQTVIKLLAQTPTTLFVYWEISQEDVSRFIKDYGNDFFNNTKPVLSVYNETKNYYFDIDINDFANSWYINVPDEDCKYSVTLKRVFKVSNNEIQAVEITSSNELIIPNGHVLSERPKQIEYVNCKTNVKYIKDVCYYKDTNFYKHYIEEYDLNNPSSSFNNI